ncbi:unnamed protein product, partial [Gadus morhua 'NCC']
YANRIHTMETPDQVEACYTLMKQLEEKKTTPKQERKFDELIGRHNEKKESLGIDWTLTELEKLIDTMETPDQVNACYALWERLEEKKKTLKQEMKFDELFERHIKKMETMDLVWVFNERDYRSCLEDMGPAAPRPRTGLSATGLHGAVEPPTAGPMAAGPPAGDPQPWIDQILKKEEIINTDNNPELSDQIRKMKRVKDEQEWAFYKTVCCGM